MAPPRPSRDRPDVASSRRLLGALLVDEAGLSAPDLERALDAQEASGERLGEVVVRLGLVGEEAVARALARQLSLPYEAPPLTPEPEAVRLLPPALARRARLLPLSVTSRTLRLAMGDPLDLGAVDEMQFRTGRRVEAVVTTASGLDAALAEAYEQVREAVRDLPGPGAGGTRPTSDPVRPPGADEAPVSRLVDALLQRAASSGASDLHVEQGPGEVIVRERVDGILRRVAGIPPAVRLSLLSRIKVLAGMDISVRRRPQDGGFSLRTGERTVSVRVSTLPVEGGEKAVLRLLDPEAVPPDLDGLGLSTDDLSRLRALIRGGRGVVLAAGPTGSGKSSTLFGALGEVDRESLNVVTLEDPIEYRVRGVNQVQVNPRAGLTFPAALRSVLRQDPDVVMVGEIRDRETAEIAMAAAVTGHLVLSTVHTTDAPGGITRLLHMGVPAHLVAGGLAGIVAQRLLRRSCGGCGGHPEGCPRCHRGYRGRTGVFEVLVVTEGLREEIVRGGSAREFRRRARLGGMGSMSDDARRKVAEGITTPHEVVRVLPVDPGDARPCARCGVPVPPDEHGCPACGRAATPACRCGRRLRKEWRFCPSCLRRAPILE